MSRRKERPDHLEIGMDVVRTPETIYDTDDGGKGQHRPMHGYVCYIHPRGLFHTVYKDIRRPGADKLLAWLESTDFFTAPAGAKHHGAHAGGLVVHSLNVWNRLREITLRDTINGKAILDLAPETNETVAILALLHDVCKVGVYHTETKRRRNPDTGTWEDYQAYTFRDPFPLGHGEKSLYLITKYMALTEEEALAIRWHMGAFDDAVKGGSRALDAAMDVSPWVWRLHEADMCAARIDERKVAGV